MRALKGKHKRHRSAGPDKAGANLGSCARDHDPHLGGGGGPPRPCRKPQGAPGQSEGVEDKWFLRDEYPEPPQGKSFPEWDVELAQAFDRARDEAVREFLNRELPNLEAHTMNKLGIRPRDEVERITFFALWRAETGRLPPDSFPWDEVRMPPFHLALTQAPQAPRGP